MIRSTLKYTYQNLLLNKSRSVLTILGIIIGVASVIAIMAVGASAQELLLSQFTKLGSNLIGILPGASDEAGPPASVFGIEITTLKYEDALALEKLPHYLAVASYIKGRGTMSFGNKAKDINYTGTTPSYLVVENASVAQGRFFSQEDVDGLAKVIVLGSQIKKDFFGSDEAIGKWLRINQTNLKVIGLMAERGTAGFENQDEQVFIPVKTVQKILLGIDHLAYIHGKVDSAENVSPTVERTKETLRFRHHIKDPKKDDFSVRNTVQALEILGTITQAVSIFLALVAAISLIVGGIGIMNIMFVSVNERTREIGLRKALGAKRRNILLQFLMESIILTLSGGIAGIILGILIALAISLGVNYYGYDWRFMITSFSIIASVLMAISIGLIFGLWPANRASKLDPIKALKYE